MNQYQGVWSVWDEAKGFPVTVAQLGGHPGWDNLADAETAVSVMVQGDAEVPEIVAVVDQESGTIIPIVDNQLQHEPLYSRREERVSYELHKIVARKLLQTPRFILSLMPSNIESRRNNSSGLSLDMLDEWEQLYDNKDIPGLINVMLGTTAHSIDMRQLGPFAGALTPEERLEAIYRANPVQNNL